MRDAYISGRLGDDPKLHSPQNSEYSCLSFSIANNDEFRNNENITSWFNVSFWTKKPQDWIKKLHKGDEVIICCDIKEEHWEKDGQKYNAIKFVVKFGQFPRVIPKQEKHEEEPPF